MSLHDVLQFVHGEVSFSRSDCMSLASHYEDLIVSYCVSYCVLKYLKCLMMSSYQYNPAILYVLTLCLRSVLDALFNLI
jgi:hypothetical protein